MFRDWLESEGNRTWLKGKMCDWYNRVTEWLINQSTNESTNQRTSERTNERTNKQLTSELAISLTHSLTLWSRVLLEKLTGPQLDKKFHEFYVTPKFITAFTRKCQLSLSWARSIQSMLLILLHKDVFQDYSRFYAYFFEVASIPPVSPPKLRMHLSCHTPPLRAT
jgi:hypothetical protein